MGSWREVEFLSEAARVCRKVRSDLDVVHVHRLWAVREDLPRGVTKSPHSPRERRMTVRRHGLGREHEIQRAGGRRKTEKEEKRKVNLSPCNLEEQASLRGDNQERQLLPRDEIRSRWKGIYCTKDKHLNKSRFAVGAGGRERSERSLDKEGEGRAQALGAREEEFSGGKRF